MSKSNLPGFTGEGSLYDARNGYVRGMHHRTEQMIYPANYVDQACLNGCLVNCGSVCAGSDKRTCLRICARENADCRSNCTRPGNPPQPPPPGPVSCSPLIPTGSGLPIYGNYCGPGHGDPTGNTEPVDAVDAACRTHDECYDRTNYFNCGCDRTLILSMPAAIVASPCATGKAAGAAVMSFFAHAGCICCPPWGCFPPYGFGVGGVGPC